MPRRIFLDDLFEFRALLVEIDRHQKFFDGFRAHARFKRTDTVLLFLFHLFAVGDDLFERKIGIARIEHHVAGEIQHLFKGFGAHVEHEGDARRHAFEIPDMRYGRGEFDVSHTVAADLALGHFHAALVADDALVSDALIFSAMAFPVLGRSENPFAEQTADFRLLGAVVDGFGLGYFAVRPFPYFFGRSHSYLNRIEIVKFKHLRRLPFNYCRHRLRKDRRRNRPQSRRRVRWYPTRRLRRRTILWS